MGSLVFVSDELHLNAHIPGGVQICTNEYIRLLEACGFGVDPFPIVHTRRLWVRLKIKLGLEVYQRYDFSAIFPALRKRIDMLDAKVVALNQVAMLGFAPLLRETYGEAITILILSHGNESGDFLHEIVRRPNCGNAIKRIRDMCRLGFVICHEAKVFAGDVDVVMAISDTDRHINNWLGARRSLFIPRTFQYEDIGWSPDLNRVGFVGSLNHKPNLDGLVAVLAELERCDYGSLRIRVVGGPSDVGTALQARFQSVEYVGHLEDEDLRREASTWAAFLNPVFWYSRGASTKLAMGINWGLPIISTTPGNRGYCWSEGDLVTVETPAEMVRAIFDLVRTQAGVRECAEHVRQVARSGPTIGGLADAIRPALLSRSDPQ